MTAKRHQRVAQRLFDCPAISEHYGEKYRNDFTCSLMALERTCDQSKARRASSVQRPHTAPQEQLQKMGKN